MFTRLQIGGHTALALAPLSVFPQYQRQGIGTSLILEGHKTAQILGFSYSVILGSEKLLNMPKNLASPDAWIFHRSITFSI